MLSYTTLGSGQTTKVLAVVAHGDARTVTTCEHTAATAVAGALECCYTTMPYALYPVATELDGVATQARRHLLNVFDAALTGAGVGKAGTWDEAERLVSAVAHAIGTQPRAVANAVRVELVGHLAGLDGVLVPCTISAGSYRPSEAHVLAPLESVDWTYLLGAHGDLSAYDVDGTPIVTSLELHDLPHLLYDATPAAWSECSIQEVFAAVDDSGSPDVTIAAKHMIAWVAHHRPDDLAAVTAALAG